MLLKGGGLKSRTKEGMETLRVCVRARLCVCVCALVALLCESLTQKVCACLRQRALKGVSQPVCVSEGRSLEGPV